MQSFEQIILITNQTTVGQTRVVFDDGSEFHSMLELPIFMDLWLRSLNIKLRSNQQFVRHYLPTGYKLPIMLSPLYQQSMIMLTNSKKKETSYIAAHRIANIKSKGADASRIVFDNLKSYDFGVDVRSVKRLVARNDQFWHNYLADRQQLIKDSKLNRLVLAYEGAVSDAA